MRVAWALLTLLIAARVCLAQELRVPARPANALGGAALGKAITSLPLREREERIWQEVTSGNVPDFLRKFVAVSCSGSVPARFFVLPDYLAVGSNEDYLLIPLTPYTAQRIADKLGCVLPTPKMVDLIYDAATVKLTPSPIPPTDAMTTAPVFMDHNALVGAQRKGAGPLGALTAGDKKDIVVCAALDENPGKVAIYGWHQPGGRPIQPLYLGHVGYWADYSHGVRLVLGTMEVNGQQKRVEDVLRDPQLCALLSGEGVVAQSRYRFEAFPHPDDPTIHLPADEKLETFSPVKGVRVVIDEPVEMKQKVRLVLFSLPNGNTVEQTFGRRKTPGDDWHYDIQHIGAQTRFVRKLAPDESIVVAYIEAANHSWPAWLRASTEPKVAEKVVDAIVSRFTGRDLKIALDSHSGGGAFTFAYIHDVEEIPEPIDRISFLDSEYNYDSGLHDAKLAIWLRKGGHYLCAIAYDDFSARYKGKPFVSAEGGTWGRSHAMLADLGKEFPITRTNTSDPERFEGLDGKIVFLLKENPKAEIFHTVQVERNGFIESLLSGTRLEGRGYRYFGRRAYSRLILP